MTFSGQYLTYTEYQQLGGTAIGETPFNILEFEARRKINSRTQNRLVELETIPQEVKICDYHLINAISKYATSETNASGNIASENIDGYSITYLTTSQIKDIVNSKNVELGNIVREDLLEVIIDGEHILYRGIEW